MWLSLSIMPGWRHQRFCCELSRSNHISTKGWHVSEDVGHALGMGHMCCGRRCQTCNWCKSLANATWTQQLQSWLVRTPILETQNELWNMACPWKECAPTQHIPDRLLSELIPPYTMCCTGSGKQIHWKRKAHLGAMPDGLDAW